MNNKSKFYPLLLRNSSFLESLIPGVFFSSFAIFIAVVTQKQDLKKPLVLCVGLGIPSIFAIFCFIAAAGFSVGVYRNNQANNKLELAAEKLKISIITILDKLNTKFYEAAKLVPEQVRSSTIEDLTLENKQEIVKKISENLQMIIRGNYSVKSNVEYEYNKAKAKYTDFTPEELLSTTLINHCKNEITMLLVSKWRRGESGNNILEEDIKRIKGENYIDNKKQLDSFAKTITEFVPDSTTSKLMENIQITKEDVEKLIDIGKLYEPKFSSKAFIKQVINYKQKSSTRTLINKPSTASANEQHGLSASSGRT